MAEIPKQTTTYKELEYDDLTTQFCAGFGGDSGRLLLPGRQGLIFEDAEGGGAEPLPKDAVPANGHVSYLPGLDWLLADSYPDAEDRQHVVLYNVKGKERFNIGSFPLPRQYNHKHNQEPSKECRCDLHPRFSRDGRSVVIDAPHAGGRQLHLIDVSQIVG